MMPTETLRAMLDERGVEHNWTDRLSEVPSYQSVSWWFNTADRAEFREYHDGSTQLLIHSSKTNLTPEQAIADTLGTGTCKAIISDNLTESEGTGDAWADCSECGHLLYVLTDPNSEPPNFCPNCGRRLEVDE